MPTPAGSLNREIRFERREVATNDFNEQVGAWVEFASTRAKIVSLDPREKFAAMQAQSEASARIVTRYTTLLAAVKPTDRIRTTERIYDIVGLPIDPDGRRRELHFVVSIHDEAQP